MNMTIRKADSVSVYSASEQNAAPTWARVTLKAPRGHNGVPFPNSVHYRLWIQPSRHR